MQRSKNKENNTLQTTDSKKKIATPQSLNNT